MTSSIFEESFNKAATLLSNKIEIVGRELSKRINSKVVIQQKVKELYGALCEIDGLTKDELDIALRKFQINQLKYLSSSVFHLLEDLDGLEDF